jgi:peptidoglycan/LPS O-acetylase OafA/YrhL
MASAPTNRQFGLDLIRAIAISLVVASHYVNGIASLGHLGVDLFFVLSGYLIGSILYKSLVGKGSVSYGEIYEFLRRRWYRTVPNYLLFLALYFVLQHVLRLEGTAPVSELPTYLVFSQNFAWPRPQFFIVSWSLCIEEWFYALCAALFLTLAGTVHRLRGDERTTLAATAIVLILAPLALRTFFPITADLEDERSIVVYRLDAIAFGLLLAVLKLNEPRFWTVHRSRIACAGLVLFLISHLLPRQGVANALSFSILSLSLCLLIPWAEMLPSGESLSHRIVTKISLWSYSIYLLHMLIYLGMKTFVDYDAMSVWGKLGYKVGTLGIILAVSAANYRYFEKPMMELRNRKSILLLLRELSASGRAAMIRPKSD